MEKNQICYEGFDTQFSKAKHLNWLPFVGKNYPIQTKKAIFVGESHYYNPELDAERVVNKNFTRLIANDGGVLNLPYASELYKNINRIYNNYDSKTLWNKVAYMNIVQRPMNTLGEKPLVEDFQKGWYAFVEVAQILDCDFGIFFGNTVSNYFNDFCRENHIEFENLVAIEKINGAYFKKCAIKIGTKRVPLYFTKHPSSHFSVEQWRAKLNEYHLLDLG